MYLKLKKTYKKTLVHYLNGERDIKYLVKFYKDSNLVKFVATFHKPKSILYKIINKNNNLKYLDGALALGKKQANFIKDILKIKHVKYIPHGVDTEYFRPNDLINYENNYDNRHSILFVGQHLRDFELFNRVTSFIKQKWKNINVNVVVHPDYIQFLRNRNFLKIHSRISDNQLKKLYQESSFLLLPLIDSTACNSILESLACGTPIITTDVGDNKDYLDHTCSIMLDKKSGDFIDAVDQFISNGIDIKMRQNTRKRALKFDWQVISKKITQFHDNIIS